MFALRSLFSSTARRRASARAPRVPQGLRVYAFGDVHGRDDLLEGLFATIAAEIAAAPDLRHAVVGLGDYIDRGPRSRTVLERLAAWPLAPAEPVLLMGNHEAVLLDFLERPERAGPLWMRLEGATSLAAFGIVPERWPPDARAFRAARELLAGRLDADLRALLESLRTSWSVGDYFFVHAGARPGRPLERQDPRDLLWIREEFTERDTSFDKFIVHGHTPVSQADIRENRVNIDTGAYATGRLTCLVLEGAERRFLTSTGRD